MIRISGRGRAVALLPLAALGVHQLRYAVAYGGDTDAALSAQGHGYLGEIAPIIVLPLAWVGAEFINRLRLAGANGSNGEGRHEKTLTLAIATATVLLAIFSVQELIEGYFASGHAAGLAGVFGDGGLWAVPGAVLLGSLVAILLRGAEVFVALIAAARTLQAGIRVPVAQTRTRPDDSRVRIRPLATRAAERAPPRRLART